MFDWVELAATVMERLGLTQDKELAALLQVKPQNISNWRNGRSQLGTIPKLIILDKLGYTYARDALLAIAPEETREKLLAASHERTQSLIENVLNQNESLGEHPVDESSN